MPLTKEQFTQLRQKGLSTEQIISFEKGEIPKQEQGFFSRLATDPINTLITRPALRTGQALAAPFVYGFGNEEQKRRYEQEISKPTSVPILGDIQGVKSGKEGAKQILGETAQTASYLYTGGLGSTAVKSGLAGRVLRGTGQGMKTGAVGGGLYSFGDAIQDAENSPSDVAYKTLFGTGVGAVGGGVLGAATPLVIKAGQGVIKYRNINALNEELMSLNNTTLRPTPSQSQKWIDQKVDPIKTYTEIFATDIPQVDKQNRFVRESVEDFVTKVDDVYRPAAEGFNTILRNSPEVNSISKMEADALARLDTEFLTPVQVEQAKAKIRNEIAALREEARQGGILLGEDALPVAQTDNYKDRFWANTKYFGDETTSVTNSANRALGRAFAENIENAVNDVNVKAYNKQLQQYIVLKDFLESKAGKSAGEGGKMTRLFSRMIGGIAGSQGGPVGSLVGSLTGDKLAQLWINPATSPQRWLIIQALKKLPEAERRNLEKEANQIIQKMFEKRAATLRLPAPSYIEVPSFKGIERPAIVVGGKKPPISYEQAQKRQAGLPEYGSMYDYFQAQEASQKAAGIQSKIQPAKITPQTTENIKYNISSNSTTKSTISNLEAEARKYKTAEEFVKAQGKPMYRGTQLPQSGDLMSADTHGLAYGKGVYLAKDKAFAEQYGKNIAELYPVLKKPLVMSAEAPKELIAQVKKDYPNWNPEYGTTGEDIHSFVGGNADEANIYLQKLGYDGLLDAASEGSKQTIIFDPTNIKTKSHLIDIWNKAKGK